MFREEMIRVLVKSVIIVGVEILEWDRTAPILALWLWATDSPSLRLSFPFCSNEMIAISTSQGSGENSVRQAWRMHRFTTLGSCSPERARIALRTQQIRHWWQILEAVGRES